MSARENIAKNIVSQLDNMTDPSPNLVSREKFDIQKIENIKQIKKISTIR